LQKQSLLLSALLLASTIPLSSQVEQAAILTTGISCGVCAAVSEVNIRRMPGVDRVTISLAKETIIVFYKPDGVFSPRGIREVLEPLSVGVVRFQITVRGRVKEEGGKRFFSAGKDKFILAASRNDPVVPRDTPVLIEGVLNDRLDPMEVFVMNFKQIKQ